MAYKDLKHLSRSDLVEIIFRLRKNEAELQTKIEELQDRIDKREAELSQAGTVEESAQKVRAALETVQGAVNDYLIAVKSTNEDIRRMRRDTEQECRNMLETAKAEAEQIRNSLEMPNEFDLEPDKIRLPEDALLNSL